MLEKIKSLLGIKRDDTSRDAIISFIIDDVTEIIKNYCGVDLVPPGLNNTVIRMAIDIYRNENLGEEEGPVGSISSITEGDTSVSYKGATSDYTTSMLKNYKTQLNRFRKVVW
ncbi:MAG: phage head-tail connector protein [Clostridium sp.]